MGLAVLEGLVMLLEDWGFELREVSLDFREGKGLEIELINDLIMLALIF